LVGYDIRAGYNIWGTVIFDSTRKEEEEVKKVIKSYEVKAVKGNSRKEIEDFGFSEPEVYVVLGYSVAGGNVVSGSPEVKGYSYQGMPVIPENEVEGNLGIYWDNGVKWIKMGGAVDKERGLVSLKTRNVGSYQLRIVARTGSFAMDKAGVYPRIITPNGDGWNDYVNFVFENPLDSEVKGEIMDVRGSWVAELKVGVVANSLMWDGRDSKGNVCSAGVYMYQIKCEGKIFTGTVVIAR
ncbi:MAG: gliding motility-associated C-terminal domain-containing protein, partial [bacterium]